MAKENHIETCFISLLDVPDFDGSLEKKEIYLQWEDQSIKCPTVLYENSAKLKRFSQHGNILSVEDVCSRDELF